MLLVSSLSVNSDRKSKFNSVVSRKAIRTDVAPFETCEVPNVDALMNDFMFHLQYCMILAILGKYICFKLNLQCTSLTSNPAFL